MASEFYPSSSGDSGKQYRESYKHLCSGACCEYTGENRVQTDSSGE